MIKGRGVRPVLQAVLFPSWPEVLFRNAVHLCNAGDTAAVVRLPATHKVPQGQDLTRRKLRAPCIWEDLEMSGPAGIMMKE